MNSSRGTLYRYPEEGKVAGVCAGIAHHFNLEPWLVRVLVVAGAILSGSFFIVGYVALWFILDKAPASANSAEKSVQLKSQIWQAGEPPRQAMRDLNEQFSRLEKRLRSLEGHVTSTEFQLNRQISRL